MPKKTKFDRALPDLDDRDLKILSVLALLTGKRRFNELLKLLKFPKPTLSVHLKHLTQEKIVKRTVEDVQKVTYEIDRESFMSFLERANLAKEFLEFGEKEKRIFESMSLSEKIGYIYQVMIARDLALLNAEIRLALDKSLDNELNLRVLSSPVFRYFELLLASQCREDKEYGKKAIQEIDKLREQIRS